LAASGMVLSLLGPVATSGLMTGGAVSIVAARTIAEFHAPITWLQWLILMLPPAVLIMVLLSWYVTRVFLGETSRGDEVPEAAAARAQNSPAPGNAPPAYAAAEASPGPAQRDNDAGQRPWSREERIVVGVLVFTLSLWLLGSRWEIPLPLPATLAVTILSLPQIGLVTRATVQRQGWDEIMVIGAALSLSHALSQTGAIQWI